MISWVNVNIMRSKNQDYVTLLTCESDCDGHLYLWL